MAQRTNLASLIRLRQKNESGYRHLEKDPILSDINALVSASGMTHAQIERHSGISVSTLKRWDKGDARKPQNLSIDLVLHALGKRRAIVDL